MENEYESYDCLGCYLNVRSSHSVNYHPVEIELSPIRSIISSEHKKCINKKQILNKTNHENKN